MVEDFITFKALPDKVDAVKALYRTYLAKLADERAPIKRYALYQSRFDDTEFVTYKAFATRADEQVHHHMSDDLAAFVESLNELCEGGESHFREVELYVEYRSQ